MPLIVKIKDLNCARESISLMLELLKKLLNICENKIVTAGFDSFCNFILVYNVIIGFLK